jgi:hypothetical protein
MEQIKQLENQENSVMSEEVEASPVKCFKIQNKSLIK